MKIQTVREEQGKTCKREKTTTLQQVDFSQLKYPQEWFDKYFPIVPASTITTNSSILQYKPQNMAQAQLKVDLQRIAKMGMPDFRAQAMDPYINAKGEVCYEEYCNAEIKKSAKDWDKELKNFLPQMNSRMGTKLQYSAFLGLLIKQLVEERQYNLKRAWYEVCNDSSKIANCWDSPRYTTKYGVKEPSGSRKIGKWYDLGNTRKIVIAEQNMQYKYYSCGSNYATEGFIHPLTFSMILLTPSKPDYDSTGWCVMDVVPTAIK